MTLKTFCEAHGLWIFCLLVLACAFAR